MEVLPHHIYSAYMPTTVYTKFRDELLSYLGVDKDLKNEKSRRIVASSNLFDLLIFNLGDVDVDNEKVNIQISAMCLRDKMYESLAINKDIKFDDAENIESLIKQIKDKAVSTHLRKNHKC